MLVHLSLSFYQNSNLVFHFYRISQITFELISIRQNMHFRIPFYKPVNTDIWEIFIKYHPFSENLRHIYKLRQFVESEVSLMTNHHYHIRWYVNKCFNVIVNTIVYRHSFTYLTNPASKYFTSLFTMLCFSLILGVYPNYQRASCFNNSEQKNNNKKTKTIYRTRKEEKQTKGGNINLFSLQAKVCVFL